MSDIGGDSGWLEAAIAWEVCASLHRQYCKGKDALFTTRQSDFVKHAENARGRASHGQAPAAVQVDSVPKAQFDDPKVQAVYAILCDDADWPPKENPQQHWEGWIARRIVDALLADSVLEDVAWVERERICAAIKAEDDYCVDLGDYMLDSNDCIKIVRGEWVRPDFSADAARKQGGAT